ncbi:hypothetical protein Tco_0763094 [Tanacetum coccineum]
MPIIRKEDVSTSISPTIDIVSRITNVLKISNSLGSNLSNVPSSSNSIADCTVHFGNDQFAPILGYGDLNQGNVMIKRVYYVVKALNHNLFWIETSEVLNRLSHDGFNCNLQAQLLVLSLQNVVPTVEKTDSSQQGLEFLFSPLLEEYYNPAYGHAEDKTMIKHRMHRLNLSILLYTGTTNWPNRLCARARSVDDMPFRTRACMGYTRWVFCKRYGRPKVRHLIYPTKRYGSRIWSFQEFVFKQFGLPQLATYVVCDSGERR